MLAGTFTLSFAQQKGPPPPDTKRHGGGPPCNPSGNNGGGNGNDRPRPNIPPPVGLCLPIDTNIYFLMAIGVMYGAYKLRGSQQAL